MSVVDGVLSTVGVSIIIEDRFQQFSSNQVSGVSVTASATVQLVSDVGTVISSVNVSVSGPLAFADGTQNPENLYTVTGGTVSVSERFNDNGEVVGAQLLNLAADVSSFIGVTTSAGSSIRVVNGQASVSQAPSGTTGDAETVLFSTTIRNLSVTSDSTAIRDTRTLLTSDERRDWATEVVGGNGLSIPARVIFLGSSEDPVEVSATDAEGRILMVQVGYDTTAGTVITPSSLQSDPSTSNRFSTAAAQNSRPTFAKVVIPMHSPTVSYDFSPRQNDGMGIDLVDNTGFTFDEPYQIFVGSSGEITDGFSNVVGEIVVGTAWQASISIPSVEIVLV